MSAKRRHPPYAVSSGSVTADVWELSTRNGWVSAPREVEGWDPSVTVTLRTKVSVDFLSLRGECGLARDSRTRLTAGWYCPTTRTRATTFRTEVTATSDADVSVTLVVPGDRVAHSLFLELRLVLMDAGKTADPVAASIAGSILWSSDAELALEGVGARFPTEWLDFDAARLPGNAAWFLSWEPQRLDAPVLGVLRLVLNSKNEFLRRSIESSTDSAAALVHSQLRVDVVRQLIQRALMHPEFGTEPPDAYDEDSMGRMLHRLVAVTFPGTPIATLRAQMEQGMVEFEGHLQATFMSWPVISGLEGTGAG